MSEELIITWCKDPADADSAAAFFVRQVSPAYISHAELQLGRAIDSEHWSPNLAQLVADEIRAAAANGTRSGLRVAMATKGSQLRAMALVSFHCDLDSSYAVIEDLVVDKALRRHGIGNALLIWIEQEVRTAGCQQIFLESGISNREAHHFFEQHGFRPCSVVMRKSVDA